jgi:hypothetical protein
MLTAKPTPRPASLPIAVGGPCLLRGQRVEPDSNPWMDYRVEQLDAIPSGDVRMSSPA